MFSGKSVAQLAANVLKLALVGLVAWLATRGRLGEIVSLQNRAFGDVAVRQPHQLGRLGADEQHDEEHATGNRYSQQRIEDGVGQNVIIATPTTLIALLKAVSYGWRQEQMAENAQEVSELGKTLYERLRVFTNHFADIGKGIERALDSYNRGVGSFEGRVLRTARKFKERGALSGEDIDILEPIDKATRALSLDEGGLFPDLVAADEASAVDTLEDESLPLLSLKSAAVGEK